MNTIFLAMSLFYRFLSISFVVFFCVDNALIEYKKINVCFTFIFLYLFYNYNQYSFFTFN